MVCNVVEKKSVCRVGKRSGTLTIGDLKAYLKDMEDAYSKDDVKFLGELDKQVLCVINNNGVSSKTSLEYVAEFGLLLAPQLLWRSE